LARRKKPRDLKLIATSLSFLPSSLAPYSSIITIILLFADGAIFGLAAKKGMMSIILIIIGIMVAGLLGLSAPLGLSIPQIVAKVLNIALFQAQHGASAIIYTFPIFWVIGFAVGIWKG
jgi:hypothetical protein